MDENQAVGEQISEDRLPFTQMGNPHRCIDENHWGALSGASSPRDIAKPALSTAQCGKALGRFTCDQGLESGPD
jgi:hypothetical protein